MNAEHLYQIVDHHITKHYKETFQTTEVDYDIINSRYSYETDSNFNIFIVYFTSDDKYLVTNPIFYVDLKTSLVHNNIFI